MESDLVSTAATSHSTLRWILSLPMASVYLSGVEDCWPFPHRCMVLQFCSQSLSSSSGGWVPKEQLVLLWKTETKKALNTSAFSSLFVTMLFPIFSIKAVDSQPFFCCGYIYRNIFYCILQKCLDKVLLYLCLFKFSAHITLQCPCSPPELLAPSSKGHKLVLVI